MGDPTPPLDEFLPRYDADDNVWWAMDSGHHMNLFDEAIDRMQAAEARLAALLDAIGEHPTELRVQASMLDERGDHFIAAMLRRIAAAMQPSDPKEPTDG
jgi:transposase